MLLCAARRRCHQTGDSRSSMILHAPYRESICGSMESQRAECPSKFQSHPSAESVLVPRDISRWEASLKSHNKTSTDGLGAASGTSLGLPATTGPGALSSDGFLKLFRPISVYMKHVNFDLSDARQPELKPIFPSLALLPFFGLICAPLWLRSTS